MYFFYKQTRAIGQFVLVVSRIAKLVEGKLWLLCRLCLWLYVWL